MSRWNSLFGKQTTTPPAERVTAAPPQSPVVAQKPATDPPGARIKLACQLVQQAKGAQALEEYINPLIAEFEHKYTDPNVRVYCAGTLVEKLTYLTKAAMDKRPAVIADLGYAYAYYFKGYIAVEQKDTRTALENFEKALDLCPDNSQFLSELANLYQGAREWTTAMELYTRAEENAPTYEAKGSTFLQRRAMRGKAFVLVEQHRLDEAEKLHHRCLELDPQDHAARHELDYIARRRGQMGPRGGSESS